MTPIEALADAIMDFEGWHLESRSYRNRNPGNLRASLYQEGVDRAGYSFFRSLAAGYDALIYDLTEKVTGHSSHHLTPESTLIELMTTYAPADDNNKPSAYCQFVCDWMTRALGKQYTPATRLKELLPLPYGMSWNQPPESSPKS